MDFRCRLVVKLVRGTSLASWYSWMSQACGIFLDDSLVFSEWMVQRWSSLGAYLCYCTIFSVGPSFNATKTLSDNIHC